MPRLIASADPATATLAQCVEALSDWGFDPAEPESVSHAASWLRRLGNDRAFLGDILVDLLAGRPGDVFALHSVEPNCFLLAAPEGGNFAISASVWPSPADQIYRASGPRIFGYGVAHDHNFDFLALGYFGPGCEADHFTYDRGSIAGLRGEAVALEPLGRSRLEPGQLLHYRAGHDVHCRYAPAALSVSLNLSHVDPACEWDSHFTFDIGQGRIERVLGHGPSEAFLRIAVALGGEEAHDLARHLGRTHESLRMRHSAWRALASIARDDTSRAEIWHEAERFGAAGQPVSAQVVPLPRAPGVRKEGRAARAVRRLRKVTEGAAR